MYATARGLRREARKVLQVGALLAALGCGAEPPEEPGAPQGSEPRVVATVPSLAELVVAMGATEHLVARTDYDSHPALSHLPSVGGGLDPSLETLVELDVDVVLLTESREGPALADRLGQLGIGTRLLPTNTVDDVREAVSRLGELLDERESADSLWSALDEGLDEIRRRVAGRRPVRVMYVVWSEPPMTSGGGTFVDEIIGIAGGENVFADAPLTWPTVGFESIVARDPEVLLWPESNAGGEADLERLRSTPGWQDVSAVIHGRLVFIDGEHFNRPGPGMVASAEMLARALHPEAF